MQVQVGQRVGPYEVLGPVGVGGMGEVYRARDEKLEREIALKILPNELSSNPEALRRFEQEARAASALNHPNIVTIYEINRDSERAWIAMELVDGQDLRTMSEREPMSLKSVLRVAAKIAEGLAAAHDRGIVHRDLKPENVMISRDGFVKILDFGLAKQVRMLAPNDLTLPHTTPGAVFGTVAYMSPEQASGREMDARSDQFSFGVMLYELLTRSRPFERDTKPETMTAIIRDEPPPPSTINPAVPRELDRIVSRCLAKQPRERYGSTRDLAHDLREARDLMTQPSSRSNRPVLAARKKNLRPLTMAIATAVVVIALVGIGVRMWTRSRDAARITAVAVMPFRDLTGSPDGRMLADGISEMVATRLAEVRELRVAAPFDGVPIAESDDLQTAARRKGVQGIIRGTVQRGGDQVRVTYALVNATTGATLFSASTTRSASELFALEDSVADQVIRTLGKTSPGRDVGTTAALGPDDQQRFTKAVGLLRYVSDEKSVDAAISSLQLVLANARDSGPVNAQLARALLFKSELARRPELREQATVYAVRAVGLGANDADAHVVLGSLQIAAGAYADALSSFQHALELRPADPDATGGVAEAFEGLGRAADAEKMYRKAVALRPDAAGMYMKYGVFCYGRGRYADAATHFQHAATLMPKFSSAYSNLGSALQVLGRYDDALNAFQRSLAINATAPGYSNLGTLQFELGRYGEATKSYEQALEIAPGDFVLWANLGDARRWSGAGARATEAYRRAIAAAREELVLKPNDAYTHATLALCLARSGDAAAAQTEIRRALEIDPTHPTVLYKSALIATLRGNTDSAVSWLERAINVGYPAKALARDPELVALRGLPSFNKALQSAN